jgi:hypothetical protein
MPGSLIGEVIGEVFLRVIFEGVCYFTGHATVRLFTFRKLHVYIDKDELDAIQRLDTDNLKAKRTRRKIKRIEKQGKPTGDELCLSADTVALIGMVVWIFIGIFAYVVVAYVI